MSDRYRHQDRDRDRDRYRDRDRDRDRDRNRQRLSPREERGGAPRRHSRSKSPDQRASGHRSRPSQHDRWALDEKRSGDKSYREKPEDRNRPERQVYEPRHERGGNAGSAASPVARSDTQKEQHPVDLSSIDAEDDAAVAAAMGFVGFESTKGRPVAGNAQGAVDKKKKVEYRQILHKKKLYEVPLTRQQLEEKQLNTAQPFQ